MNRFSRLRPGLFLVAALSLGLAGCDQGFGPGLSLPSTDASTSGTAGDITEQTLEAHRGVPSLPEPSAEVSAEPAAPIAAPTPPASGSVAQAVAGPVTPVIPVTPIGTPSGGPAREDCIRYNPANLTVVASGDAWLLRDGNQAMKIFDTAADAEDARRVARNWRQLCFIGRGSTGPDRYRYIINYFTQASGLPVGPAPATINCISYDPADLQLHEGPSHPAEPDHPRYWSLYSGPTPLLALANHADALRAEIVASGYTRVCFIGAGNDRPDPYRYQMEWWRP